MQWICVVFQHNHKKGKSKTNNVLILLTVNGDIVTCAFIRNKKTTAIKIAKSLQSKSQNNFGNS
jgi:predicted hydrolase (HD superfamily)